MTTNQATGKIKASRVNNLAADTYVGPAGQIWYDVLTGVLRLGDNVTPGGTIIGGGTGNGTPGGPNASIQFNNGGVFGGNTALTFDAANSVLNLNGAISATGNVTGNYFIGNGALLTGVNVSSNAIFNGDSNVQITAANANVTIDVAGVANVAVFTPTGLDVTGNITATGDITTANITATGDITVSNITATGNITASDEVAANLVTAEHAMFLNANVVTQNYTIPPGYNALSAGPITIPDGVVVDSVSSNWGIV